MLRAILPMLALAVAFAGCSSDDGDATPTDPTPTGTGPTSPTPTGGATTSPPPGGAMTHTINIVDSTFVNGTIAVRVGDTVHWVHQDGTTFHSVTAEDGSFDSSPDCLTAAGLGIPTTCMAEGETFDHKFDATGSFAYTCKVHPSMTGTITVV